MVPKRSDLAELATMTHDIAKRCYATKFGAAVQLCKSVIIAVGRFFRWLSVQDATPTCSFFGRAALNLNQFLQPETLKTEHIKAIEQTVEMIHARSVSRASAGGSLPMADSA